MSNEGPRTPRSRPPINGAELDPAAEAELAGPNSPPIALGFALRLVLKVGLLLVGGVMLLSAVFWALTAQMEANSYNEALQNIDETRLALVRVTVLSALGQVVVMGGVIAAVALLASHKIAGPLIRFERQVRDLAEGNFRQRIQFRKGDQNQSLTGAFDALSGRLRQRVTAARAAEGNLREVMEELAEDPGTGAMAGERAVQVAERMRREAEALRKAGSIGSAESGS